MINPSADIIAGPSIDTRTNKQIRSHEILDADGICATAERTESRHVLINKCVLPVNNDLTGTNQNAGESEPKHCPVTYKGIEGAYVEAGDDRRRDDR